MPSTSGTDVGAAEVDRRVRVHGLEAGRGSRVLAVRLGRRGRRRRDAVAERRHLRGACALAIFGADVVADPVHRRRVPERRDDLLVPGLSRSRCRRTRHRSAARCDRAATVGEEGEGRVVDDHEHVLVLHQILRRGRGSRPTTGRRRTGRRSCGRSPHRPRSRGRRAPCSRRRSHPMSPRPRRSSSR